MMMEHVWFANDGTIFMDEGDCSLYECAKIAWEVQDSLFVFDKTGKPLYICDSSLEFANFLICKDYEAIQAADSLFEDWDKPWDKQHGCKKEPGAWVWMDDSTWKILEEVKHSPKMADKQFAELVNMIARIAEGP